jgi:hypothetical protein
VEARDGDDFAGSPGNTKKLSSYWLLERLGTPGLRVELHLELKDEPLDDFLKLAVDDQLGQGAGHEPYPDTISWR